eukprot:14919393-Alexandrium_andersonii.AAC.1
MPGAGGAGASVNARSPLPPPRDAQRARVGGRCCGPCSRQLGCRGHASWWWALLWPELPPPHASGPWAVS